MQTLAERRRKHAEYMREYRKTHKESRTPEGIKKRYAWMSERRRERKAADPEYAKRLRQQNRRAPESHRAHEAVRRAIKSGRLVRPDTCEECGAGGTIEAAHFNYSERLRVRWLCLSCHRSWDRAEPKVCQP